MAFFGQHHLLCAIKILMRMCLALFLHFHTLQATWQCAQAKFKAMNGPTNRGMSSEYLVEFMWVKGLVICFFFQPLASNCHGILSVVARKHGGWGRDAKV